MSSLIDSMLSQLKGAPVSQIAQQLGIDAATAQKAIASALPLIVGALSHHAQQPGGVGALLQSLLQGKAGQGTGSQTQGGLVDSLGGMLGGVLGSLTGGSQGQSSSSSGGSGLGSLIGAALGGGAQSNAGAILGQLFGGAQSHAQEGLGKATGLGAEKARQLLQILTPFALSHVAQHAQTNNLDSGGLTAALGQAQNAKQNQGGSADDLLSTILGRI
ncbi:MAG: DUF937 domain-containing protein [Proteobacteria bacterium]|nr:DUF937 domain-containing protein [Pseudomonadota bacterium]